jgi:voltage-gated potassium channel
LLATAPDRRVFLRGHVLELLVVIVTFPLLPALFWFGRLVRLLRIVIVGARVIPGLHAVFGRRGLVYVGALTLALIFFAGGTMSFVEPHTVRGDFWAGVWWAVATATTVGYGDISPVTPVGRLVAAVLMLCGIGLTATLAASVAAHFIGQDQDDDINSIKQRLARIEALLAKLDARAERDS